MRCFKAPLLAALMLCAGPALAQNVSVIPRTGVIYQDADVTTSSGTVVSALAVSQYQYLQLINSSALGSGNIYCLFGGAGTAAVGGGHGEIPIAPFQSYAWETSGVPAGALNCISDSGTVHLTFGVK